METWVKVWGKTRKYIGKNHSTPMRKASPELGMPRGPQGSHCGWRESVGSKKTEDLSEGLAMGRLVSQKQNVEYILSALGRLGEY